MPDFGEPDNTATSRAVDRAKGAWERRVLPRVMTLPGYACAGRGRRQICDRRPITGRPWTRRACLRRATPAGASSQPTDWRSSWRMRPTSMLLPRRCPRRDGRWSFWAGSSTPEPDLIPKPDLETDRPRLAISCACS
jgi:hypothetical protein